MSDLTCPYSYPQVVRDEGRIQRLMGRLLQSTPGLQYFVDGRRTEEVSYLYQYSGEDGQYEPVHHFVSQNTGGDCLTYSSGKAPLNSLLLLSGPVHG